MKPHKVGTMVSFTGSKLGTGFLTDVTLGKVYMIEGDSEWGDEYFIDDTGEQNYAASTQLDGGDGIYDILEEE